MGGRSIIDILFGQKIEYDLFDDTLFEFSVGVSRRCVLTHPSIAFFNQMSLLVALQTFVSALLAYPLYKLNVQRVNKDRRNVISSTIFTFLVALPIACYEPIVIIRLLDIRHLGLRMVLMTLPLNGGLRILECKREKYLILQHHSDIIVLLVKQHINSHLYHTYYCVQLMDNLYLQFLQRTFPITLPTFVVHSLWNLTKSNRSQNVFHCSMCSNNWQ